MIYEVKIHGETLEVKTIDVRSDILHECDILEDVAVAYGINNFTKRMPLCSAIGTEEPMNRFTDKIRLEFALMGFNEVLSLTLLSKAENFVRSDYQVILSNPKSREYEVMRTSLVPGLLKSIGSNLHGKIPIKVFEAADIVLCNNEVPEGAVNRRSFCACIASNTSMLEELQGPVSLLMNKCGFYDVKYEHYNDSRYLENQGAEILIDGIVLGTIGVLDPKICNAFKIPYAASAVEIDLEKLFEKYIVVNK